jgi:hypothetical protein
MGGWIKQPISEVCHVTPHVGHNVCMAAILDKISDMTCPVSGKKKRLKNSVHHFQSKLSNISTCCIKKNSFIFLL